MGKLLFVVVTVSLSFLALTLADKRDQRHKEKYKCLYDRKTSSWSQCSPTTHKKTLIMALEPGQPTQCEPIQSIEMPCTVGPRRCEYDDGKANPCDPATGKKVRIRKLKPGSDLECPLELRKEMPCKASKEHFHLPYLRGRSGNPNRCEYDDGKTSRCNPGTGTKMRVRQLTPGSNPKCRFLLRTEIPCMQSKGRTFKDVCDYVTIDKTDCDQKTNTHTMTLTKVKGDSTCKRRKVVTHPCNGPFRRSHSHETSHVSCFSVPYDYCTTGGLAQTGGNSSSISVAHLSKNNQNSSGSRQPTNSVISRRLDRSLIPGVTCSQTSHVFHFRPIDAYSRIERRIPNGRLYGDVSVVHFPVICAGVVVLPVGGDNAVTVQSVFRFPGPSVLSEQPPIGYSGTCERNPEAAAGPEHGAVGFRVDFVQHRRHHGSF
ncbi:hypothetical protein LSH36_134g01004 [Paralvinella palmiformis]|uniref:Uncharacterized protein n=1 Tax=Paralvinella palmiformis TaxID=53620 RepID=A0AAD9JX93_9ANNE|nr:hypothetical protein LSH36_134g01004 [Paralvinella palmiformis]